MEYHVPDKGEMGYVVRSLFCQKRTVTIVMEEKVWGDWGLCAGPAV